MVSSGDLRDYNDRPTDLRSGDLRHLREQGLVETVRVPGSREHAVTLTKEGRSLLEHHRDRDQEGRQTFYNGIKRARELEHDSRSIAPTNVRQSAWRSAVRVSSASASITSSSVSISDGYTSATENDTTTTATRIAATRRSSSGRSNMTCRTSMMRCTSLISALSTRRRMAGGSMTTSMW